MLLSDAMSMLNPQHGRPIEAPIKVHLVMFSNEKLQEIHQATTILQGWPSERKQVNRALQKYWPFRGELSLADCILKGTRVIIPKDIKDEYLKKKHEAHKTVVKCQMRAKCCLFLHMINKDFKILVKMCSQAPEPLMPHNVPDRPWQVIATEYLLNSKCI